MDVIKGNFGAKAPSDLASILRQMADDVDAARITAVVIAAVEYRGPAIEHGYDDDSSYVLHFAASLETSLVLSTLLCDSALQKFKV